MKLKQVITSFAAATLLAGCDLGDESKPPTASSPTAKEVKEKIKEAAETTKDYVTENKDEFVARMNKKLAELDDRIAELAKKSESYKDDAKVQANQTLASLKEQRGKLNEKFEAFKQASADTWKDMKAGFATAVDELEKTYERVKAKLN